MGDRTNEWGQRGLPLQRSYRLDRLSRDEIDRAIEFLEKNNSLGDLEDLDAEERVAVIVKAHEKQLLVLLKEATQNKTFDAIIEDEYRHLATPFAQQVYGLVSAIYQYRKLLRDAVIADATKRSWSELHRELGQQTEGVISWLTVDAERGIEAGRCRHAIIAKMVWARCISPQEQGAILRRLVDHLNLYESVDRRAFDVLVKNFDEVGGAASIEDRISFFETACRKDPDNPFVRQHYARMFLRAGDLEAAVGQADLAVNIDPLKSSVRHTRGLVYSRLALTATGDGLARKRLSQAEQEFRTCIRLRRRDHHPYESLARMYAEWAEKRETDPKGRALYQGKAQTSVLEGLRVAHDRAPLLRAQARIDDWLENDPTKAEASLRRAGDDPAARHMLARLFSRQGRYDEAEDLCKAAFVDNPKEHHTAVLYAELIDRSSGDYQKMVAVLGPSRASGGLRDPRHVAMLGGALQLQGKLERAREIFQKARGVLSRDELHKASYRPRSVGRLDGKLQAFGRGIISAGTQGDFRAKPRDIDEAGIAIDAPCRFQPVFGAGGGVARELSSQS